MSGNHCYTVEVRFPDGLKGWQRIVNSEMRQAIERLKAVVGELGGGKLASGTKGQLFFRLAVDAYCSLFSGSCTIISVRIKEGIIRIIARRKGS